MSRAYACILSVMTLVAVLAPIVQNWRDRPADGYPLSRFPGLSRPFPDLQQHVYVVAVDEDGTQRRLPHEACGPGGIQQIRKQLRRYARRPAAAHLLCRSIAQRLGSTADRGAIAEVRLVTGTFDTSALTLEPIEERIHAAYRPVSSDDFPAWVEAWLASRPWTPARRPPELDRTTLRRSFELAREFLVNNQTEAGNFNYEYDFSSRSLARDDSQVRQAGALWGVALAARHEHDEAANAALDRGLRFFLEHSRPGPFEGSRLIAYPGEQSCATGTVALVALALIDTLRDAPSTRVADRLEHARAELERALDGYLALLRGLRREDGHFAIGISLADSTVDRRSSPYFDGESLLCLVKAAKYLGKTELIPLIEASARRMAKYYTADQWDTDPDSDLTKGFFQWSCMAFQEYAATDWKEASLYGDVVLALSWWMVHIHRTLDRTRNTAYAHEGIIQGYRIAAARGHDAARAELAAVIDAGLRKLTGWQVGGPFHDENALLARHPNAISDPLARGGIMNHRREPGLRIDVTQHQLHAIMLALEHVYPARASVEEAVGR